MKLTLENFQAHKNSELDLEAFTVIVGHSNAGKTAIIRALKSALYNDFKKSYVKIGEKSGTISLTGDKMNLSLTRDKALTYTINGTVYGAVGRSELQQLVDAGFFSIEIDKKKYYPQIARQFDNPFIISYSDSEISKLLSELSQTGKIKQAKKNIIKKSAEFGTVITVRENDREKLQTELISIGSAEQLETTYKEIVNTELEIDKLQKLLEKLVYIQKDLESLQVVNVPKLPSLPVPLLELQIALNKPVVDLPDLSGLQAGFERLFKVVDTEKEISEASSLLEDTEKELKGLVQQMPELSTCDQCGQPVL